MSRSPHDRWPRASRERACRAVCDAVGMSCVIGRDGWDDEVVRLAEAVDYDRSDIVTRPKRVASEITRYLDDQVKNP